MEACDFYLFADQDDVWKRNKLQCFTEYYNQNVLGDFVQTLIYGNMEVVNEQVEILYDNLDANDSFCKHAKGIWFAPTVWGCNMFMNKALFMDVAEVSDLSRRVWGHNQYYARWASIRGKLFYMNEIVFSYRRHQKNVSDSVQKNKCV